LKIDAGGAILISGANRGNYVLSGWRRPHIRARLNSRVANCSGGHGANAIVWLRWSNEICNLTIRLKNTLVFTKNAICKKNVTNLAIM
jgi:hypothetical protein